MNYQACLNYLHDLGHELRGVRFRLEAITAILERLGDPHRHYSTAIVAGTNGKGSTAAMLAGILRQAGYRVGLYTSPHLVRVNERICVNGEEISDEDFARAFTEVEQSVERLLRDDVLASRPSFFEFLTAAAFVHFSRAKVDLAVLEVGMGGRLDATNVIEPAVAIITNIELDHQEYLGTTHAEIAGEKAGIIKPGCPVISGCAHPEAARVIRERAAERGARLIETPRIIGIPHRLDGQGRQEFDFALAGDVFPGLVSPLLGRFQTENAVAAVAAACELRRKGMDKITGEAIKRGLRRASWPGRLEPVCDAPLVLLDGAHNPAAAREVAAFIRERLQGRTLRLVYASMRDKAIGEISEILFPLATEVYLTQPDQPRAAQPQEILSAARSLPSRVFIEPSVPRAISRAIQASSPHDVVLAVGSLFLVGAIKEALRDGSLTLEPKAWAHA